MERKEKMAGIVFLTALIYLIIDIIVCNIAGGIAEDKGYEKNRWFWICFWLPFGFLLVAALPDLKLQEKQQRTNELLQKLLGKMDDANRNQITGSITFLVGLTMPNCRFSMPSASLDMNLRQCFRLFTPTATNSGTACFLRRRGKSA